MLTGVESTPVSVASLPPSPHRSISTVPIYEAGSSGVSFFGKRCDDRAKAFNPAFQYLTNEICGNESIRVELMNKLS